MWNLLLAATAATLLAGDVWPSFRGDGSSLTTASNLPVEWSDNRNVTWSAELVGYGQSSPIVWGEQAYVISVVGPTKDTLVTAAYRVKDGKRLWIDQRRSSNPTEAHERMAKAAPTPAADENGVYVFFESGDLIAFDHSGRQRWTRYLPREGEDWVGNHGLGSSLRLSRGRLYLHVAPSATGRLYAIDTATGKNFWVQELEAAPSFSTPLVVEHDDREILLTSAGGGVIAYDCETGEELFRRAPKGGRGYAVPSLSHSDGIVVVASSEAGGTHAFLLESPNETLWTSEKATTEFSSPLIHRGRVYLVNSVGVLFELELATGATASTQRLAAGCWASPIAADSRLYFFGLDGTTTILSGQDSPNQTVSSLGVEGRIYGAAIVDGSILLRSGSKLVRISGS